MRRSVAWLERAVSMLVDTASAATAFVNPPTPAPPAAPPSGKGISEVALFDSGKRAFVILNMRSGPYQSDRCAAAEEGNEGIFSVSLRDPGSARWLGGASACIHSGFTLLAAAPDGARVVAWDQTT
jgi:hypothetical protein